MDPWLDSARTFVEQVYRIGSWTGELPPATSLPLGGARAMTRLVMANPALDGAKPDLQLRLFGPTDDPDLQGLRNQSVGYLLAGALALGMTGQDLDGLIPGLVIAAGSIDPKSLLERQRLLGDRPFGPPIPVIPDWLEKLDKFTGRDCFAGVMKAVLDLGKWASSQSKSDAKGISSLSATTLCSGGQLTIYGAGFGRNQPADTKVYVPVAGGGCREATVVSWSDTAILVQLPADVAAGCVGFVRFSGEYHEPQQVTGELTNCIGAVAEQWTRGFGRVGSPIVSCPPCLLRGQNRIQLAGKPSINGFRFTPSHVEPNGQPVLEWNVSNANTLQIVPLPGLPSPPLALPNPIPPVGSITLAPVGGLVPVNGRYRLIATNGCGSTSKDTEFTMSRTPTLSVGNIEIVQSIQKVDNSVRLTAERRTAVRVFVDSGIVDGFDLGAGPNRVGGLRATLYADNVAANTSTSCTGPWVASAEATSMPNRDMLEDSINFDVPLSACRGNVRFRAVVELPGPMGQPPLAWTTGSVDVTFIPKPTQELLPLLITDPSSTSPAPTMTDFFNSLMGPHSAQPFPENGFVINPPILMMLSPVENLKIGIVWTHLIVKVTTMIFLFPSTPVGGIRAGMVPNDSAYPWGGMALPRIGLTTPSFIAQAGDSVVCTHELGHTFGLNHMNCGGPMGPYDGTLPLTITDPGLDVPARMIFPAGTNEAMSYCFPQWPSIEHWDRIFDRIPI